MSEQRRWLGWALRLLGPVLLVVVLWRLPSVADVLAVVKGAEPVTLGAALLVNLPSIYLKVVRWQALLRARGVRYGLRDATLAFSASLYVGMLTPGRVGDLLRIQYLRHDQDVPYAEGLASIVMDRLCDLYVLVGFVALAIARYSGLLGGEVRAASWLVVVLTAALPLVLLIPGWAERLFTAAYRRLSRDDSAAGLALFLAALRAQVGRALFVTVPLTVVAYLVSFGQGWLVARSLGLALPFFDLACLLAVANLMGLLPISVSGVGVREAFFAAVFPALGYSAAHAVGFGLLVFVVVYLSLAAIGFVAWQIRPPPTGARAQNDSARTPSVS